MILFRFLVFLFEHTQVRVSSPLFFFFSLQTILDYKRYTRHLIFCHLFHSCFFPFKLCNEVSGRWI